MPFLFTYLLKLSVSLAVVFLFYQFVLRKLTFYNWNRWWLLIYTLLCFFIPFFDISPVLQRSEWDSSNAVTWIPVIGEYKPGEINITHAPDLFTARNIVSLVVIAGMLVMFLRLLFQLASFHSMMKKAKAIPGEGMNLYQVDEEIIPFSFGNSIFINQRLHPTEELQEIIRHEFVHVKQKHSLDIIWCELLCLVNWYNPFAWLLKRSIRQNLEFIADSKVLENGINKKQYQYLLLKVIGNNQFSIAPKFNFSSLKKRIAMMNKLKTARLHLVRFLFIFPLLAVILVSFRQKKQDSVQLVVKGENEFSLRDTIPGEPNEKGYTIDLKGKKSNAMVIVKDKNGRVVERVTYSKWKGNEKSYEDKYGELPPPPPPPLPPTPPTPPESIELPENVKKIEINNKNATVVLKDGKIVKYDLDKPVEKAAFEKKYGEILPPPPPPPPKPKYNHELSSVQELNRTRISDDFEITDKEAVMRLKNGKVEKYDLANPEQRKKFEEKYGRIINIKNDETGVKEPFVIMTANSGQTTLAAMNPSNDEIMVIDPNDIELTGKEDILITITKNTTEDQLESFKKQMKEKGIELRFDNINYNDGVLVSISGTMRSANGHNNFVATDFNKLVISTVQRGEKIYFKVSVTDNKTAI